MLIFIDDSGDSGFKLGLGSSEVFVIALIIFRDNLVAEETALAVKKLRRELGFSDFFEFKFNKADASIRSAFLERVKPFAFEVRAIVVRKDRVYSPFLRTSREGFYNFVVQQVLAHYNDDGFIDATVKIDGRASRILRKEFDVYLRKMLNSPGRHRIRKIKHVDSRSDMLIQLADMVAGAIRRSYGNKMDAKDYRAIIERKISIWEFR